MVEFWRRAIDATAVRSRRAGGAEVCPDAASERGPGPPMSWLWSIAAGVAGDRRVNLVRNRENTAQRWRKDQRTERYAHIASVSPRESNGPGGG